MEDNKLKDQNSHASLSEGGHPYPISVLAKEWPKIKAAPFSFASIAIACFVFGAGSIYSLYNFFVIPGKDATIQAWQAKAEGAGITQDGWPPLDNKDVLQFAQVLNQFKIKKFVVIWGQEIDAARFFRSLQAVGKAEGFTVESSGGNADSSGICFYAYPDDPCAKAIADFLNSHGYQTKIKLYTQKVDPSQVGMYEFFIGDKP